MENSSGTLLSVSLRRLPSYLAYVAFVLVALSTFFQLVKYLSGHDHIYGLVSLFNLNEEKNLPSSFSAWLLSLASILLILSYSRESIDKPSRRCWGLLAFGFGFMALDEICSFHERLNSPVRHLLSSTQDYGIFYYAWVLPALLVIGALSLCFVGFLKDLERRVSRAFITSALLYLGGAIGMEMVGGWYAEKYGPDNLGYVACFTLEESLEMAGVIYFINSLLFYLRTQVGSIQVKC